MSKIHHECELERYIVEQLVGSGWRVGESAAYDRARALYPEDVEGWIRDSQPEAWTKLERLNGAGTLAAVLDRLAKTLESKGGGTVNVLRRGFAVAGGGNIAMSQPLPEDERNATVIARYEAHRLRVVPQLVYSLDTADRIDLVFFINGMPVATVEIKTDFTQSVEAAMAQYRHDRPPKNEKTGRVEPLLAFRRGAVVHFAMSDSDIRMATKLAGAGTFFLPFNRGNDGAAGNPPGEAGDYPVSYLWQRVLQKDNWLRIFHRFVLFERKEVEDAQGHTHFRETLIFPRFHQWEGVNALVDRVRAEGCGQPYLIQHSAGSGKTNTISWTAHELIRIRRPDGAPYFHSVIVVTDRTVLDKQLQDAIAQIEHQTGVVQAIDGEGSSLPKSQQLAQAMLAGTPIIVCTLQTFPHAQKLILGEQSLRDRRFAVVIDEAHSSTGGSTADDLRYVLTGQSEEEWGRLSAQERLSVWQASRQRPGNASYFAFTATPKHSTLSLFGRPRDPAQPASQANPPVPFHTYTMQQAIEEGFILDVLRNYTSYRAALRIGTKFTEGQDDRVDKKSAGRALAKWLSLHPTNVGQKVELIVEHFRANVAHLLAGQAKAMVVTPSRAAAVKYHLALGRYCQARGYDNVHAMVAFSGEVPNKDVDDAQHPAGHNFNETNTNPGLNGREMRKAFDTKDYRVMIVANKFQTGFDQPKLVAMYLDKKVSSVEAVQTLSRLNRTAAGKDKTFVIDFVNEPKEILDAFKTFYRDAQVSDVQDPNIVYDIKQMLDATLLYETAEVAAFAEALVSPSVTHQKLYSLTQAPTDRFNNKLKQLNGAIKHWEAAWRRAKDDDDQKAMAAADSQRAEMATERDKLMVFSEGLNKFVRTYEYVGQLVDFGDPALEGFASFARLLRKRLRGISPEQVDLSDLTLTHFRVARKGGLDGINPTGEAPTLAPITDNGLRDAKDREKAFLSELVKRLNDALGKEISDTDQVAFAVHVSEKLRTDDVLMAQVQNNAKDQAMKANLPAAAVQAIFGAMETHKVLATKLLSDEATRGVFVDVVYELLRRKSPGGLFEAAPPAARASILVKMTRRAAPPSSRAAKKAAPAKKAARRKPDTNGPRHIAPVVEVLVPDNQPPTAKRELAPSSIRPQPLPDAEAVDAAVFCPPEVPRASRFMVQVYLYPAAHSREATDLAKEADAGAERRGVLSLLLDLPRETRVDLHLEMPTLNVEEADAQLIWRGATTGAQFEVEVPPGATDGTAIGRVRFSIAGVPAGTLRFQASVVSAVTTATSGQAEIWVTRYHRAFVSYSSTDRAEVLRRVQAFKIAGISVFQDILDLDPGERWEKKLYYEIDKCDVFLLFWSKAAAKSPWVRREIAYAIARQKGDPERQPAIQPVPIEGPPIPARPASLRHLHFNDPLLAHIAAAEASS